MEFCNGWCPQPDVQRSYWDGPAHSAADDVTQVKHVADSPDAGAVSEDGVSPESFQILSRL